MGEIGCARIRAILDDTAERFGWAAYTYTFTISQDWTDPGAHCVHESSRNLALYLRRYRALGLGHNLHRHAMVKSDLPQVFEVAKYPKSRADRLLAELNEEFGFHSGLVIPRYGYGGALGLIALLSRDRVLDPEQVRRTIAHVVPLHADMNARARERIGAADAGLSLTAREVECLSLVAEGRTSREIAEAVGITPRTVEFHIQNAIHKLGCTSRSQAATRLSQLGLPRAIATSASIAGQ